LGFRVGVWIDGAKSFVAENAMIYGGVPIVGFGLGPGTGSPSFALSLRNVGNAVIRHSTLYSGPSGFPTVGTAIKVFDGVSGLIVQNNILAVDPSWTEPLYVEPCASTGVFARIENNLLFNLGQEPTTMPNVLGYGSDPQGGCGAWAGVTTIDALTTHVTTLCAPNTPGPCAGFGGTKVSGNLTLKASCGTDSGCIPWSACSPTTPVACLASVLEGWSPADNGLTTLLGPGWQLAAGLPCAITKSSLDLGVGTDLFGTTRTSLPSMGAHERDGSCIP
jgi:hypothetical protein